MGLLLEVGLVVGWVMAAWYMRIAIREVEGFVTAVVVEVGIRVVGIVGAINN